MKTQTLSADTNCSEKIGRIDKDAIRPIGSEEFSGNHPEIILPLKNPSILPNYSPH